jgi:hypothetical protein
MTKPGDVVIDEITLRSYTGFTMSLKGVFQNITLYEDIFGNCMSGSITVIDSMNIVKHFPIIGAETLTVTYRTPYKGSPLVKLVFRTFKISLQVHAAQPAAQMVRIEFVSPQAILSMQRKVSKSYSSMSVSGMVGRIYDEFLAVPEDESGGVSSSILRGSSYDTVDNAGKGIASVEETFDIRSYVIPYWSPLYTINWLCHRARSKRDTTLCDYVFFENSDGHHFVPLSRLKKQDAAFTYTDYVQGFRSKSGERMIESELRNIIAMTVEDTTDKVRQQMLGMLSSSILTHDITTKSWTSRQFNYDESYFSEGAHVEKHPLIPPDKTDYTSSPESHLRFYPNSTYTMEGLASVHDYEETVLLRQSLVNQLNAINLIVECHGDSNVKVGQVIELRVPSIESLKMKDDYEDEYLKGRYLVTTLKHVITDRDHRMTMTLSRDSFASPLADVKKAELLLEG